MKKISVLMFACIWSGLALQAQVSTIPAEDIDPEDSLTIRIDISKLDASQEHVQNLLADVAMGLDLYIWTWQPFEFPEGHPKSNGTGTQAWKSSNELLKLTEEAPNIYTYKMIPTEFYEVDAATVYQNDIEFLVKPKDGGGFGDPDRKSDDLKIAIDPPNTERDAFYTFPKFSTPDDIVMLVYENDRETKTSMQDLGPEECYFFPEATLSDSTKILIEASLFTAGNNPKLKMEYAGDQTFKKYIHPLTFFEVPEGKTIISLKAGIIRKQYLSGADRSDAVIEEPMDCP